MILHMAIISRGCPNLNWILTLLFTDSSLAASLDFLRWLKVRVDFKGDTVLLVIASELTRCRIRNPGTLRNRFGDFTQLVALQNERYWRKWWRIVATTYHYSFSLQCISISNLTWYQRSYFQLFLFRTWILIAIFYRCL